MSDKVEPRVSNIRHTTDHIQIRTLPHLRPLLTQETVNSDRAVDRHLEDQLVVYQCLAEGRTCFDSLTAGEATNSDSSTTQLSKAAASALLPNVQYDGKTCAGAAVRVGQL